MGRTTSIYDLADVEMVCQLMTERPRMMGRLLEDPDEPEEVKAAIHRWNLWLDEREKYIEREAYRAEREILGCTAYGVQYRGDGDTRVHWYVYPATMTDEEIMARLGKHRIVDGWDGGILPGGADCTGKWFCSPATIERTRTRVLVTIRWVQDV